MSIQSLVTRDLADLELYHEKKEKNFLKDIG